MSQRRKSYFWVVFRVILTLFPKLYAVQRIAILLAILGFF